MTMMYKMETNKYKEHILPLNQKMTVQDQLHVNY